MKVLDIKSLSGEELTAKSKELREELFNLKFQLSLGQLENTAKMRELKRTIARIKTVQREHELALSK
ncbi:MAG: 50S ribosomal protein L29 [Fusobacteria bacterium]|nr:50S ribosomal protein L29 [Fusobacteriota bacterium]